MVSILDSIKKMLGIELDNVSFDEELIMFINGALMIITQLGLGPASGFVITGNSETWDSFTNDRTDIELIKTSVYHRVRLSFDPPTNSFLVKAIQDQITEYDWRIEISARNT